MEQDFFPDEGDHAVAAAEGDGTDLEKGEEQLQEHITSLLSAAQEPRGHACRTAEEDEQDGRDADARQRKARHRQKDGQEDAGRKEGAVERLQHPHTSREDEIDDADLNAFEGVGNDGELGELLKNSEMA